MILLKCPWVVLETGAQAMVNFGLGFLVEYGNNGKSHFGPEFRLVSFLPES